MWATCRAYTNEAAAVHELVVVVVLSNGVWHYASRETAVVWTSYNAIVRCVYSNIRLTITIRITHTHNNTHVAYTWRLKSFYFSSSEFILRTRQCIIMILTSKQQLIISDVGRCYYFLNKLFRGYYYFKAHNGMKKKKKMT